MPEPKKTTIEISTATLFKILAVVLAVVFSYFIWDIVIMSFIALVLASAISPWVDWLQKWKLPRSLSAFFIYVVALGAIFSSLLLLINPISIEIKNLADDFPSYWQKLSFGWQSFEHFSESHGLQQGVYDAIQSAQATVAALATNIFGGAISFVGSVFNVLVVLVIAFYLAVYDKQMKRKIASVLPEKYQDYSTHLINRMQEKIGLWLRGQLVLSLIIFLLTLGGLSVLGVKYVWVLALIAGVAEIIPYFGPIIAGVPAVFIAFTQSPLLGLLTLLLFVLIQQCENYLITPQIMRRAVGLNPVVVIIAMMIGAKIAGIAGIIIAVPVTTALSVMIGDILEHRQSGFSFPKRKG
ncbi:MAG: AI-2E family transporter [Patescibacteria group bacterium]